MVNYLTRHNLIILLAGASVPAFYCIQVTKRSCCSITDFEPQLFCNSPIPTTHLPLHYPQKSFSESIVVFRLSTYKSIIDAGKCIISHEITILSNLVPDSSTILILHINGVSFSFCDFGGLSIILLISTSGVPGLVISIRFSKISITGPAPVIEKS